MSNNPQASLVEKIVQLYREFQQALHNISREQLEGSKNVMGKMDTVKQEELRKEIEKQ